jgi:hypothetical protein
VPVQVDGDAGWTTPLEIKADGPKIRVIVPG